MYKAQPPSEKKVLDFVRREQWPSNFAWTMHSPS